MPPATLRPWWHDLRDPLRAAPAASRRLWLPGLICFALATAFMLWASASGTDRHWLDLIVTGRDPGLIQLAKKLSNWGELHFIPLLLAILLWAAGRYYHRPAWRLAGAAGLLGAAGAGLLGLIFKILFGRPRPHLGVPDTLNPLSFHWNFQSFPSGHSSHTWGLVAGVALLAPRWALPYGLFAAAVCWSRMYLNRHYPSDILGGLVCGVFVGLIFALAARRSLAATKSAPPSS